MNTATLLLLLLQPAITPPVVSARASTPFRAAAAAGAYRAQARP